MGHKNGPVPNCYRTHPNSISDLFQRHVAYDGFFQLAYGRSVGLPGSPLVQEPYGYFKGQRYISRSDLRNCL